MGSLARNQALANEVIGRLLAAGVRTFCLCPGGRNAPLVEALDALAGEAVQVLDFFEERSAAFFALGRARRDLRPVAIVTTSGTASAELLPAMVEAYYSRVPLVAVTADRPRSYRGTGAPQAIEQGDLFGVYACQRVDLDQPGAEWTLASMDAPAHVNVSFNEPLLAGWDAARGPAASKPLGGDGGSGAASAGSGHASAAFLSDALRHCQRPLVVLGALSTAADRGAALAFCRRLEAPVLAEASSYLKPRLDPLLLSAGEVAARRGFEQGLFDSVIRLGDIPSFRLWRDLEVTWRVPVVSVSRKPWRGLTHGAHLNLLATESLAGVLPDLPAFPSAGREKLAAVDREAAALTACLLDEFPESEPAHIRRLSQHIPSGSFVYLGNSLPIREWNQFAVLEDRGFVYGENRGANGIDGQLSTFLGGASDGRENWALVGDLTALYDVPSAWALRHVNATVRLVVVNNGGGRIFQRMYANPRFQNRHGVTFEAFAALWGMNYSRELLDAAPGPARLIELRPSEDQTDAFWKALRAGGGA